MATNASSSDLRLSRTRPLKDFQQTRPHQLQLFQLAPAGRHSNLVGLYDAAPKYLYSHPTRVNGRIQEPLQRVFEYKDADYSLTVKPVLMKDPDGIWRDYLPGEREELVEDALRKLAVSGQGIYLEDPSLPRSDLVRELASVFFTLRQLQAELRERGHSYSLTELRDAIDICAGAPLILESRSLGFSMSYPFFVGRTFVTRDEYLTSPDARCFVRFHPLVSASINERSFRRYDYQLSMTYRRNVARWLHKRLSERFTQAARDTRFSILLSTMLRSSGCKPYASLSDNIRDIKIALDEMKAVGTLQSYEVEVRKQGRKIVDALFALQASDSFTGETIESNKIQAAVRHGLAPLDFEERPAASASSPRRTRKKRTSP